MSDLSNTQFFQVEPGPQISAKDILEIVYKALKEKGYKLLLKLMPLIPDTIHAEAVVQIGDPAQNIVAYSEEHPVDLIIIGNRGLSGLKKILLGSVSNYVLLRSHVPILIMK